MTAYSLWFPRRILALLRREAPAAGVFLAMSATEHTPVTTVSAVDGSGVRQNGNGNGYDGAGRGRLVKDRLSFVPMYDRGGPLSLTPSADGPITTLARVELNARRGVDLDEGLDDPDQLNKAGSP